ncbi:MAG: ornithine carbamoyltransferase [Promethearchaeota archaeon]
MRDLLTIKDYFDTDSIISLLDLADKIKKNPDKFASILNGKTIILIFEKTSTRTRISFEAGMYQLGGNVIYLDWRTANFHLGALTDEIICISSYTDLIIARVYEHETLEIMRKASKVPIINGLSDKYHPCQILSDLMTIREHFGSFSDLKVAFIGDGNNICNSLIIGCIMLNIPIIIANPEKYKPLQEIFKWVKEIKKEAILKLTENPIEAVKDVNVIYTDTFVSMGQEAEKEKRLNEFKDFQVNQELLKHCKRDYIVMHCLPAHRGIEITDDVIDSENSIIFQQAENRLYLQKALMLRMLNA